MYIFNIKNLDYLQIISFIINSNSANPLYSIINKKLFVNNNSLRKITFKNYFVL